MKLPLLVITTLVVLCHTAYSSIGQDMIITLTDTIYGEVQVDLSTNRIRVRKDKNYQFLNAAQVRWIRKSDKNYCVASFGIESRFLIFEVLSTGSKSLLYREGVKFNPYDEDSFPPFFILDNRSAYSLGNKKEFLSVFGPGEKKVKDFARDEGLTFTAKEDVSRIFDFFNRSEWSEIKRKIWGSTFLSTIW